jgi:uncharacterized pyridoxamine 5'-phosphate oxidase family protein
VSHQLTDRERRIYEFLQSNPIGILSSTGPNGDPHGSVIYFSLDKHFNVSFITKAQTKKYDNLSRQGHVMLTVFEPKTQTVAQITGKAQEIKDDYIINQIAGAIHAASLKTSEAGLPPITKLEAGEYVAFQISPNQIKMAVYARPDGGDYTELFETIESYELKD